jgi:hypothetical protein
VPADSNSTRSLLALMRVVVAEGTEQRLAHLTLRDDPFARWLQPESEQGVIDFALAAGQAAAEIAIGNWGRRPEGVAATLRVPITRSRGSAQIGRSVLFSEYGSRPPAITLYAQSVERANLLIQAHHLEEVVGIADVAPLHLAHELYHHLEAQKLILGTAQFRIQTHRLGPLRLTTGLPSLSEIAADRLATALLELKVPPKAVEFITLWDLDPEYAWSLLTRLQTLPA